MTYKMLTGAAALTATMLLAVAPARAQATNEYPWCAHYGALGMGATNCGFSTQAQCRAALWLRVAANEERQSVRQRARTNRRVERERRR